MVALSGSDPTGHCKMMRMPRVELGSALPGKHPACAYQLPFAASRWLLLSIAASQPPCPYFLAWQLLCPLEAAPTSSEIVLITDH